MSEEQNQLISLVDGKTILSVNYAEGEQTTDCITITFTDGTRMCIDPLPTVRETRWYYQPTDILCKQHDEFCCLDCCV